MELVINTFWDQRGWFGAARAHYAELYKGRATVIGAAPLVGRPTSLDNEPPVATDAG